MRRISVILSTTIVFLMMASAVVFNACTRDLCKDLICKNNGVCRDGRCRCSLGYEGVNCDAKMNEKFVGTWDGSYRCNGLTPTINTNIIAPGDKPNEITMYNIFNQGSVTKATVDLEKVTIAAQTVDIYTYAGDGYIEDGKYITIFIQETNNQTGEIRSCVYNATKLTQP